MNFIRPLESSAMNIFITGSSGIIGSALIGHLLSKGNSFYCHEDPLWRDKGNLCVEAGLQEFVENSPLHAVINTGTTLPPLKRWQQNRASETYDNKIHKTRILSEYIAKLPIKPKVFIVFSHLGFYGDRGDKFLDETSFVGDDFHAEYCRKLELATTPARQAGIRVVNLRPGMIISNHIYPLLQLFVPHNVLFKGVWGTGKQYKSWISLKDATRAIEFIINNRDIQGPVNLTGSTPLTNLEFTQTFNSQFDSTSLRPFPAFLAQLLFEKITVSKLLFSCRALPRKLTHAGFSFRHLTLEEAIAESKLIE